MKLYIRTGAGTGTRHTEATRAQVMAAAADILYEIGMGEAASALMVALVHRAVGEPVPPKPEEAAQKPRRPRRKASPSPEGGKDTGEAPAPDDSAKFGLL